MQVTTAYSRKLLIAASQLLATLVNAKIKMMSLSSILNDVDAVLITSTAHIIFLTGYSNFSKDEREAYLLLTKNQKYIFTDARYLEAIRMIGEIGEIKVEEISGRVGMDQHLKKLAQKHQIKSLGIEGYSLTVEELRKFEKVLPDIRQVKLNHIRSIKSADEVSKIESACQLGDKAFEFFIKKIKLGISEKELAFEYEMFIRKNGADISFETIVAFGANSSIPHHQTGDTKLKVGDFVKLDFGVRSKNYCSDMTRTVFYGHASSKQKKIYQTVLDAQKKAAEFLDDKIKSGKKVTGKEVDKIARDFIIAKGFPSIPHSLGHGIGLEVHEPPILSPKSKDELLEGMVFSIEPGIYIPGYGGVRIEDLYLIEKNGLRQLTNSSNVFIEVR